MVIAEGLLLKGGQSILNDFYQSIKGAAKSKWQAFDWHTARKKYFEKIEKDYGTTRILGKHEPISLEDIFTDVYLLDEPTAFKRFDIFRLEKDPEAIHNEQTRLSGLDTVKEGNLDRLYILGKPGSGKTTFLKYIALKAAQNEIEKIPIFISLKEWADSNLLLIPFIVSKFDIFHFPDSQPLIEYILKKGLAIVLFDGLDETQQETGKRDEIISEINRFSRKYDESQILITCRIAATEYIFEDFTYLEIADFTDKQVELYIENWFGKGTEKEKLLKQEFTRSENKGLKEMANTPLLLSLLCLNFEETGAFPQRRVEIYEEGIRALLSKWDSTRNIKRDEIYKGLSIGRKQQMFARIAVETFENYEYFLLKNKLGALIVKYLRQLPDAPPKDDIDGERVLEAIEAQHSIFVERALNIYSFSHLTFQEYFTAKYIVDNSSSGTLDWFITKKKITDKRWQEVILNTASLFDNADNFFNKFQNTLPRIIDEDEDLINFFNWLSVKTSNCKTDLKPLALKIFYIYLAMSLGLTLAIVSATDLSEDLKLDFAETLNKTHSNDFYSLIELIKDFTTFTLPVCSLLDAASDFAGSNIATEKIISQDIENANEAFYILSQHYDLCIDFQLVFLYSEANKFERNWKVLGVHKITIEFTNLLIKLKNYCFEFDDNELVQQLSKLMLPSKIKHRKQWREFQNEIRLILRKNRGIDGRLFFSENQFILLETYFTANYFLLNCLNLAVVSDRQKIFNNLFSVEVLS